jgi:hypothetical protein
MGANPPANSVGTAHHPESRAQGLYEPRAQSERYNRVPLLCEQCMGANPPANSVGTAHHPEPRAQS